MSEKLSTVGDISKAIKLISNKDNLKLFSDDQIEQIKRFQKQAQENASRVQKAINNFSKQFEGIAEKLKKSFEIYGQSLTDIKFFVAEDWYVSYSLFYDCSITDFILLTREHNTKKLEEYVLQAFEKKQKKIFGKILKASPDREIIINEIENLYKQKYYYSLIPLCYAQVDGICKERFGISFFDTDKKEIARPLRLNSALKTAELSSFSRFMSDQLDIKNAMTKNSDQVTDKNSSFNRHVVIHGNSKIYGTKINAIRSILLLDFISELSDKLAMGRINM